VWLWRQKFGMKWSDKLRNENVLCFVEEDRAIINSVKLRKHKWIGHALA